MALVLGLVSAPVPSTFSGGTEGIALVVLLTEFAMLRAALSRSQIRLYAFQSLVVSGLAALMGVTTHVTALFVLAGLSFVLKVLIVPGIMLRQLRDAHFDVATSKRTKVATMVLLAIVVSAFGFFVVGRLPVHSHSLPTSALGMAGASVLVAFLLVILRADVVSQAVGFFALENGVSVASMVVAAGMPLILEVAFLFDLLVAVVVFGVLIKVHHGRGATLSTDALNRLQG
ncbi:MAG: hydrogenase [Acidimicrobiales bacterium]